MLHLFLTNQLYQQVAGIKTLIKKLIGYQPPVVHPSVAFTNDSYAQEGEDMVLKRFMEETTSGFYVDIGAHHPFRFSNTYSFYKKGWRGINVDAMPGSMELFKLHRPNDINLELPVSDKKQVLTYHIFNEPALNTFSAAEAAKKDGLANFRLIDTLAIETLPLSDILDTYLPANTSIDFLSIDVEGLDLSVLQSNNWQRYKPKMILVESLRNSIEDLHNNEVYVFLNARGYQLVAKTFNTFFFKIN